MRYALILAFMVSGIAGCAFVGVDRQYGATQMGENAWKLEYAQQYATKANADGVLSVLAREKCPDGWETAKDYQQKGPGYPIWTWEIACLK